MFGLISHSNSKRDYNFLAIVITTCLLVGCAQHAETHELSIDLSPGTVSNAVSRADALFRERADIIKLRESVESLAKVRNPDHRDYEVEWKFAKYCYFLGKSEPSEKDANAAFERGRDAGKIASRVEPQKPEGHFWFGANLGELARISPVTVGIKSVDDIREAMTTVIAIDPGYQGASAFDALGQLELAARTLKVGTTEKAVEYLEKGLQLAPDNSNIRLHLAQAYLDLEKDAEAKKQLIALTTMPPDPDYVREHEAAVEKGKNLLKKNF